MSWYKLERIDSKTYVVREPNHWENTNMYYLIGDTYNLLIDTGTGIEGLRSMLQTIDDKEIRVVSTHVHWDHIGNHREFEKHFVHEGDKGWLMNGIPIPVEFIKSQVIMDVEKEHLPKGFDINAYKVFTTPFAIELKDSDSINLGNREIEIIHTPGHSPGHVALFEKSTGYLFTGDLLYKGRLFCNYPSTDPEAYYQSIQKLHDLKTSVSKLLTGHHHPVLPADYLETAWDLMNVVKSAGQLHHGSGVHRLGELEIIF